MSKGPHKPPDPKTVRQIDGEDLADAWGLSIRWANGHPIDRARACEVIQGLLGHVQYLEGRIKDIKRAGAWKVDERAWYRNPNRRDRDPDLPIVVLGVSGQRVRVRRPGVNGPRVVNVSPASIRQVTCEHTWAQLAASMGLHS